MLTILISFFFLYLQEIKNLLIKNSSSMSLDEVTSTIESLHKLPLLHHLPSGILLVEWGPSVRDRVLLPESVLVRVRPRVRL